MPPSAKRRKVAPSAGEALFQTPARSSIQAFGRVSKPQALQGHGIEKQQTIKQEQLQPTDGNRLAKPTVDRKRKLTDSDATVSVSEFGKLPKGNNKNVDEPVLQSVENIEQRAQDGSPIKVERNIQDERQAQSTPRRRSRFAETAVETPTKGACGLLNAFALSTPKSAKTTRADRETTPCPLTDDTTLFNDDLRQGRLPEDVQDLIDLHIFFLKTLAIHRAHNGSLIPVDLRVLCPSIERAWGKKRVHLEDIRRVLGVYGIPTQKGAKSEITDLLSLSDYGMKKICLEVEDKRRDGELLLISESEGGVKALFKRIVEQAWADWISRDENSSEKTHFQNEKGEKAEEDRNDGDAANIKAFIQSLPLAQITPCSSLAKASPLLKKGQRRLEEFRIEAALVRQDRVDKAVGAGSLKAANSVSDRGQGLLARIREKQLRQSLLPGAPSKEEVARKSALQRIDEVSSVLSLLATPDKSTHEIGISLNSTNNGNGITHSRHVVSAASYKRVSFTLPTLLQNLKGSLRTPISKDEGELCIRLLADRIAPEWVSLVQTGRVLGVVLKQGLKPPAAEMKTRVAACM